ncbi:MAG: ABC transporter permease [Betaproteobacteria bacterium]|nr:ABC transporter permease [Betaproteobacteria bacterium]
MSMLSRMLWRDLWHLRGQVLAASLVAACGIAALVATRGTFESLVEAQTRYYRTHHFADVFVQLRKAPATLVDRLRQIPGVAQVETRVVADVPLQFPSMSEPATGRLVSIPTHQRPMLNALQMVRGRIPQPGEWYAVVASEALARAHGLQVGDRLQAVLNGRWQSLEVTGIALSPEYVYEVGPGMLLPDSRHFGVLWMLYDALSPVMDMTSSFNNVVLSLAPGASEPDVVAALDNFLRAHGGLGAVSREGQVSHRFITDELGELGVVTTTIPTLFLVVASFLLYVVMTRLVQTQRAQIGLLKAFGYSHARVGWHYLMLGLSTVALGTLLGLPVGLLLGDQFVGLYREYFRFPQLEFHLSTFLGGGVVAVTLLAAVLGTATAVIRAVQLAPAQAMQPSAPAAALATLATGPHGGRLAV